MICRLCHIEEETQEHIVNCPVIRQDDDRLLDLKPIMEKDVELDNADVAEICKRISMFHDQVCEQSSANGTISVV